jgi:hypothetical protein
MGYPPLIGILQHQGPREALLKRGRTFLPGCVRLWGLDNERRGRGGGGEWVVSHTHGVEHVCLCVVCSLLDAFNGLLPSDSREGRWFGPISLEKYLV